MINTDFGILAEYDEHPVALALLMLLWSGVYRVVTWLVRLLQS